MYSFHLVGVVCLLSLAAQTVSADEQPGAVVPILEAVVVSGEQPGPGLWRVSKDGHELWILGTLAPLPKRMTWQSREVEALVARSQEVLTPPRVEVSTELGMFRQMMLLPSLLAVRKNPDRQTLQDMVPAELYARWLPLKQKYLGRDREIEKRRPILAARALYEKAVKRSDLDEAALATNVVTKAAKRHKVAVTQPTLKIVIENPKAMLKELRDTALNDVDCFGNTLQHLEADIETMKARGNAWATGDIETLQSLPFTDQGPACIAAVLDTPLVQQHGLADLRQRVANTWLATAEASLAKNATTFAILPMAEILKPDGYVAALRNKAYEVEAPQ